MRLSWKLRAAAILALVGLSLMSVMVANSHAEWLDKAVNRIGKALGGQGVGGTAQLVPDDWQRTLAVVAATPEKLSSGVVAATVSGEGHWTFANRAGQRFTAANKQEMARMVPSLFPEGLSGNGLTVYLTARSVFVHRERLKLLPPQARLRLVAGSSNYELGLRRKTGGSAAFELVAMVRSDVLVPIGERALFEEVLWQLEQPFDRSQVYVLAVVNDGPAALRRLRRSGGAVTTVSRIAPQHLIQSLPELAGQMVVLTGRIEGSQLLTRAGDGAETAIDLSRLRAVAATHDISLVVLNSKAPRQPGVRNWLWLKVDIDGLEEALKRRSMADFLGSMALTSGKVEVRGTLGKGDRVRLGVGAVPDGFVPTPGEGITAVMAEIASEVVGTVMTSTVELDLAKRGRVRELRRRIIPGVPSLLQAVFVGLSLLGLLALPVAWRWWGLLWPAEVSADYAGALGFHMAQAVRFIVFAALFLPIVSVPAILWGLLRLITGGGAALVRRSNRDAQSEMSRQS